MFTFVTHLTNKTAARQNNNKTVQECVMKFAGSVRRGSNSSKKKDKSHEYRNGGQAKGHAGGCAVGKKDWCQENKLDTLIFFSQ